MSPCPLKHDPTKILKMLQREDMLAFLFIYLFIYGCKVQIVGLIFYLQFLAFFGRSCDLLHRILFIYLPPLPFSLQTPKTDGTNQCLTPRFNLGMSLASAH